MPHPTDSSFRVYSAKRLDDSKYFSALLTFSRIDPPVGDNTAVEVVQLPDIDQQLLAGKNLTPGQPRPAESARQHAPNRALDGGNWHSPGQGLGAGNMRQRHLPMQPFIAVTGQRKATGDGGYCTAATRYL